MPNISTYTNQIEVASRGEEVRDAIVNALKAMNDALESAGIGGGSSGLDMEALFQVFDTGKIGAANVYDSTPTQNSPRAVTSGGLWILLGNIQSLLDNLNGEVIN